MKKLFLLLTCASLAFASCEGFMPIQDEDKAEQEENKVGENGEEDSGGSDSDGTSGSGDSSGEGGGNSGEGGGNSDGGDNPTPGPSISLTQNPNPLEPAMQKSKIEETAKDLLDQFPAEGYRDLLELANKFYEYGNTWFDEDVFDGHQVEEVWENELRDKIYSTNENSKGDLEYLLKISTCTGKVTIQDGNAVYEDYDGIKAIVKDVDGDDWTLDVVLTQWKKNLYVGSLDGESLTIDMPSQIKVDLKVNGRSYASVEVNVTYNISTSGLDPNKDAISVSTTFKIDDISLTVSNTGYNANTGKAKVDLQFKKENRKMLSLVSEVSGKLKLNDEYEMETGEVNSGYFKADLMGELQITGAIEDFQTLADKINEETYVFEGTHGQVLRTVEEINKRVTVVIGYNGLNYYDAKLVFDCLQQEENSSEYYVTPLIQFGDDTTYSYYEFYEEHVTEGDVEGWGERIMSFADAYVDLVESIFDF